MGKLTKAPADGRTIALLRDVQVRGDGRAVFYEDVPSDPFAIYWDDRGTGADTFNLAIDSGWLAWSHDSDSDSSCVRITEAGRSLLSTQNTEARNV